MFQCFYKHYLNAFIANFYICVSFQGVLYWLLSPLDYSHDFLLFCISNNFLLYARPLFSGFSAPRGEAKPPLAGKHQPLPSAMSPLLVGRCCLLSTRSLSKEEESEWDVRVRKGPGLPATPHFAKFRPHPPFGMKLLKGPSSGCPWGVVLFLLRGVGFTGLVKCALPLPSWKPRMLVRLLEALSGGALNSQKGHQDWRLGILTSLPWMGGGGKVFPKGTGAAAWGYSDSHCPCDHSDQAWTPHPTSGVTFGRFEDNLSCVKSGELGQSLQMWPGNWGEREEIPFLSPGTSALRRSPRKSKQWFCYRSLKWRAWNSIAVACKA